MGKVSILLILSLVVLVSGCVQQQLPPEDQTDQTNQTTKQFALTLGHTFINPTTITANEGDTVVISAISAKGTGTESGFSHNHGISIDEYNIDIPSPSENMPVVISFVADRPGTFSIYCKSCWDGPFGREHPDIRATLIVNAKVV